MPDMDMCRKPTDHHFAIIWQRDYKNCMKCGIKEDGTGYD